MCGNLRALHLPSTFNGTERYAIQGQIGSGGFGVVFCAFDRERGERVALKLLRHLDASRLYAFKREFRALADVAHPNLVALYELVSAGDDWFFTMELIEGRPFLDSMRTDPHADTIALAGADEPQRRLRQRFAQLVEGVAALHRSGQLHRDLKPSNALVTDAGRVVLLDFGLVKDIGHDGSVDERVVGTVPYMSPEQGFAEQLTPASDFYSVGVMLYQALTGRLPHTGPLYDMLIAKRTTDPTPPHVIADVPRDLSELSMRLMCRAPEGRPPADQILAALRASAPSQRTPAGPSLRPSLLMGRSEELAQLERAFADAVDGTPTVVFVHGSSGVGKTALCSELARKLEIDQRAVVLRGACYERESVPYKALDDLMDALSTHLRRLPRVEAEQRMPREVKALARLFPVLERVPSVAAFPRRAGEMADVAALRQRAIAGLRELLGRMRDHRPLLLLIDDVQWGDGDSARLLCDLLTEGCPALMLLCCYRSEERDDRPFVATLMEALSRQRGLSLREIEVGPLRSDDARALSATLMRRPGLDDAQLAALSAQLAREAGGNPFFIQQLAGDLREREADAISSGAQVSLSEVLQRRLELLMPSPRALLEVVAAAAGPIPETVALSAAGAAASTARPDLSALRAAHLIRTGDERVTVYHHHIREAVMAGIDAARLADIHLRLAGALERTPGSDAEAIAEHYRRAGRSELAGSHAVRAAAEAFEKLAFERAARLYEQALALRSGEEGELYERLAEALAHAGRGPDAAEAYLRAIGRDPDRAVALRCRAAEQYFFSGHVEQGTELFHQILEATGLPPLPESEGRALWSFVRQRVGLKLRGMRFRLVPEARVDPAALLRIDVCYSVSAVLAGIRPLAASGLQTLHLTLALEAGEPYRLCRGLVLEAIMSAMQGVDQLARAQALLAQAREVSRQVDGPAAEAVVMLGEGVVAYMTGAFLDSIARLREAETVLSERCAGMSFELGQVRSFLALAMFYTGDYAEAGRRMRPVLKATRARGDRYAESMIVNVTYRHELLGDRLDEAREEVARGLSGWYQGGWSPGRWARGGTTMQEFYERVAQIRIALYAEQASRAWALSDEAYKPILRSPLGRIEVIRVETHQLRGQAALLRACHEPVARRDALLEIAGKMAHHIERGPAWSTALGLLLRAAVAVIRGERARGSALLAEAELMAREHDMEGFAHAAAWRRGQLCADAAMMASAGAWMQQQGIANPARFAALLAPGFEPR